MKFSVVAAALAGASTVYGHTIFSAMYLNGVDQGLGVGKYIRGPRNNSPVKDVTSKDIICNVNNSPVPQTLEVSAGDQITMEWFHGTRNDDIIDKSHVGPVMVYIAPTASNGEGPVWVKLFDQSFTNDWATNHLIAAKGHVTITLPDLAPGEYLLRPEIIALHEGETDFTVNSARGAQFYMGCGQIKVVSSGSVPLSAGIDFQKDYKHDSPGILFDVYSKPGSSYTSPGGAVSSIAVAGQLGIAPVPAAGSKPTTAVASSSVAPTTSSTPSATVAPTAPAAQSTTTAEATSASVTTTTSCSEPLNPSSKMVTVTIKPTPTTTGPTVSVYPTTGTGSTAALKKYYQCGGINYTGSTVCEEGTTCKVQNPYYSQCL